MRFCLSLLQLCTVAYALAAAAHTETTTTYTDATSTESSLTISTSLTQTSTEGITSYTSFPNPPPRLTGLPPPPPSGSRPLPVTTATATATATVTATATAIPEPPSSKRDGTVSPGAIAAAVVLSSLAILLIVGVVIWKKWSQPRREGDTRTKIEKVLRSVGIKVSEKPVDAERDMPERVPKRYEPLESTGN